MFAQNFQKTYLSPLIRSEYKRLHGYKKVFNKNNRN